MTWIEALDTITNHPHIRHYRRLCDEENTDVEQRNAYRILVVRIASNEAIPHVGPTEPGQPGGCGCGSTPSIATQVRSAATATAHWVVSGFQLARPETQAARRAICNSCDQRDGRIDRCRACGCWLPAKLRLPKERCPIGKWETEDESSS